MEYLLLAAYPLRLCGNTAAMSGEGGTPDLLPAEKVSWYDAIAFCNKLSLRDGKFPVFTVEGVSNWNGLTYANIPTESNDNWNAATQDLTGTSCPCTWKGCGRR